MKIVTYIWDAIISYIEELHRFRTRYYNTSPFDRYI